ncbi:MAG: hypothetical protein MZV64_31510 [Ignavibacteriales bacterium]|nr:hypothetical protein [Ignavibacteriales bacterium]
MRPLARSTYTAALATVTGGQFTQVDQPRHRFWSDGIGKGGRQIRTSWFRNLWTLPSSRRSCSMIISCGTPIELPSLGVAQLSVFPYLQNGGRVIFSTMFLNTTDPRGALKDFRAYRQREQR